MTDTSADIYLKLELGHVARQLEQGTLNTWILDSNLQLASTLYPSAKYFTLITLWFRKICRAVAPVYWKRNI